MPDRAGRLARRVDIVHDALVAAGVLPDPQQPGTPTEADMEEVARFLAKESHFVRYYDPTDPNDAGWRLLLTSETDVTLAFTKARAAAEGAQEERTGALAHARDLLVGYIESRRAAERES